MAPQWIELSEVGRREVEPVTYRLLEDLVAQGWRLRRQGHKFYVFCPCGDPGGRIRIDGTPRDAETQARRARREAAHCPDDHALDR